MQEDAQEMTPIYIDCEPKWTNIVPMFIEWLEDPKASEGQKELARSEIIRCGEIVAKVRNEQRLGEGKKEL